MPDKKEYILHDSIYVKFKTIQNQTTVLKVRIIVISGRRKKVALGGYTQIASRILTTFHFLI